MVGSRSSICQCKARGEKERNRGSAEIARGNKNALFGMHYGHTTIHTLFILRNVLARSEHAQIERCTQGKKDILAFPPIGDVPGIPQFPSED